MEVAEVKEDGDLAWGLRDQPAQCFWGADARLGPVLDGRAHVVAVAQVGQKREHLHYQVRLERALGAGGQADGVKRHDQRPQAGYGEGPDAGLDALLHAPHEGVGPVWLAGEVTVAQQVERAVEPGSAEALPQGVGLDGCQDVKASGVVDGRSSETHAVEARAGDALNAVYKRRGVQKPDRVKDGRRVHAASSGRAGPHSARRTAGRCAGTILRSGVRECQKAVARPVLRSPSGQCPWLLVCLGGIC